MNILAEIAKNTAERVEETKKNFSQDQLKELVNNLQAENFRFSKSLNTFKSRQEAAFICEVKKASPSKGIISENFDFLQISRDYETAGAAAISVLTEPEWFKGSCKYLQEISKVVTTPLLRKDFIIDPYQILESKAIGASALLLIVSLLDETKLTSFLQLSHTLGLDCLVEVHDAKEAEIALKSGAKIIGINNRNLKTFEVNLQTTVEVVKTLPKDIFIVSESGIKTHKDIKMLTNYGIDGFLIGETLMRSSKKAKLLDELRGEIKS